MSTHSRFLAVASSMVLVLFVAAGFRLFPSAVAGDGDIKLITTDSNHDPRPDDNRPRVQLAILLDTSNSMDGLIRQAQAQLWRIVNELSSCRKNGKRPELSVAIYEYGNTGLPADGGWVRQVLPFTDNLDNVSEKLFALSTNGGDEYCGRVIEAATHGLRWSGDDDDLKIIVIAGNEPFTQGPVDYKSACRNAVEHGITVNTIFCGNRSEGIATKWRHGAKFGHGEYSNIDQNSRVIEIQTPYDDELAKLSAQINGTFLFYGKAKVRKRLSENQVVQDSNAFSLGLGVAAGRAIAKSGPAYSFENDLVEQTPAQAEAILEEARPATLPESLRGKSLKEQKTILQQKKTERKTIENKIKELTAKRNRYIAKQRQQQSSKDQSQSLDEALLGALREQAKREGFTFAK